MAVIAGIAPRALTIASLGHARNVRSGRFWVGVSDSTYGKSLVAPNHITFERLAIDSGDTAFVLLDDGSLSDDVTFYCVPKSFIWYPQFSEPR